jgi:pimeloyl-ACP methyl ester carboxylesterase
MPTIDANGQSLFYREEGRGPLLLILHGNTASSASHAGELAYFGSYAHAVALDLPGCGRSGRSPVWPVDWWAKAGAAAAACVAALGEERAVVMGTSGGAVAALWAAILRPERVLAVIADSFVEREPPDLLRAEVANRARRTPDQVLFWQHAQGDDWQQVVDADSALLLQLADHGGDYFGGRLSDIACPTLLSASSADSLLPDAGPQLLQIARQIPNSRLFLHSAGDHPLMWSAPAVFRPIADAFLREVWSKGSSDRR